MCAVGGKSPTPTAFDIQIFFFLLVGQGQPVLVVTGHKAGSTRNAARRFGRTLIKLPNMFYAINVLGCMCYISVNKPTRADIVQFFSNPKQLDETNSHIIMDRYVELGGNFIDTANLYAAGNSEKIIGTWLKKYVSSFVGTLRHGPGSR